MNKSWEYARLGSHERIFQIVVMRKERKLASKTKIERFVSCEPLVIRENVHTLALKALKSVNSNLSLANG